jgi:hypothetical protein
MAHESITVSPAQTSIKITALPGFAINTTLPQTEAVIASPTTTGVDIKEISPTTISTTPQTHSFGGIVAQPNVTLYIGTQQDPVSVNQSFSNFKYKFPNFAQDVSSIVEGDIVYFKDSGATDYDVEIEKVDVMNTDKGAKGALYIFIEKTATDTLILLHKGFYDYSGTSTQIDTWTAGHTIYLNNSNKIDADVSQFVGGQWIRSLGFCVPNTTSTKRVWFEGDTTFVKIKTNS